MNQLWTKLLRLTGEGYIADGINYDTDKVTPNNTLKRSQPIPGVRTIFLTVAVLEYGVYE